jgi:hypothetical protein
MGGSLKNDLIKNLIQRIYATAEKEIDCDQTGELLAAYVDAQVTNTAGDSRFDDLRLHLNQCPDCSELFESLLQVSQLQHSGELPPTGELLNGLAFDDEFPSGT